jgi:hypothetical protein
MLVFTLHQIRHLHSGSLPQQRTNEEGGFSRPKGLNTYRMSAWAVFSFLLVLQLVAYVATHAPYCKGISTRASALTV